METLPEAFSQLRAYDQFILCKLEKTDVPGKFNKIPVDRHQRPHDPNDPAIWMAADDAIALVKTLGNSQSGFCVGFTLTAADPFFLLDIDNAFDGTAWSPLSTQLVTQFDGAALEVSTSNRGLHILGSATIAPHVCRDREGLGLELYHDKRFVALTGLHARGSIGMDCTAQLNSLIYQYFTQGPSAAESRSSRTTILTDEEVISKALVAQSGGAAFGTRIPFADLWNRNEEQLARFFPQDGGYDDSQADASLAGHLAFWCGGDEEQIERLMRQSGLMRDKYDRADYLQQRTIANAVAKQKTFYTGGAARGVKEENPSAFATIQTPTNQTTTTSTLTGINHTGFQTIEQQISVFNGCAYIAEEHGILIPSGHILKEPQFNAMYGGMQFPLTPDSSKTTYKAFEAFTQSQIHRFAKVLTTCFRPAEKFGSILTINGVSAVNTYKPPIIHPVKGDITPFLRHMEKLLPDENDRNILLSYLAALAQMPGVKFQWCPLIQGVQGNGKSTITNLISNVIGREYTHYPKASELAGRFNSWIYRKILIVVEDIYIGANKNEIIEALKPMITGQIQGIEGKGRDQVTHEIVANFILNTNHRDAFRLTESDRRFVPFHTAQQSVSDLRRDGMDGTYFADLNQWINDRGFAIFCDYILNFPLTDDFKRALMGRAPLTSSTKDAIIMSRGLVENYIIEAVEQGRKGFQGGWISSFHLETLLHEYNINYILPMKRLEIMQNIGYERHPNLVEGRVNASILMDGRKSVLYIKHGHKDAALTGSRVIADAYVAAQEPE